MREALDDDNSWGMPVGKGHHAKYGMGRVLVFWTGLGEEVLNSTVQSIPRCRTEQREVWGAGCLECCAGFVLPRRVC